MKVAGTDAWSWDAPFSHTAKKWAETNLEALPANGFTLSCFPLKIAGASAGWIRAVAIFDS